MVGADVFMINDKTLLCIVDYHSKFQIVKKENSSSEDDLVQTAKLIFTEYFCGFLFDYIVVVVVVYTSCCDLELKRVM